MRDHNLGENRWKSSLSHFGRCRNVHTTFTVIMLMFSNGLRSMRMSTIRLAHQEETRKTSRTQKSQGHFRDTLGTPQGHLRDTSGTPQGHLRGTLGTLQGHFMESRRVLLDVFSGHSLLWKTNSPFWKTKFHSKLVLSPRLCARIYMQFEDNQHVSEKSAQDGRFSGKSVPEEFQYAQ